MEELVWNTEMRVSALVLFFTFVAIFTEGIHGIHRVKCGMAGAATMIVAGQVFSFTIPKMRSMPSTGMWYSCWVA